MTGPEVPGQQPEDPPPFEPPPATPPPPVTPQPPVTPPPPPIPAGYGAPVAAPPGLHVDPESGLLIPDGTELAGIGRRIGAYFLAIPLFIITLGIGYAIWGLIVWGRGQTPTLQVLGMRAWRPDDRRRADFGVMALREVVGVFLIGFVPFTQLISFILMCVRSDRRSLHDLVASTIVLRDPNKVTA